MQNVTRVTNMQLNPTFHRHIYGSTPFQILSPGTNSSYTKKTITKFNLFKGTSIKKYQMADIRDEYGNPIQLTDAMGNPVTFTDESGNPMHLTGVAVHKGVGVEAHTIVKTKMASSPGDAYGVGDASLGGVGAGGIGTGAAHQGGGDAPFNGTGGVYGTGGGAQARHGGIGDVGVGTGVAAGVAGAGAAHHGLGGGTTGEHTTLQDKLQRAGSSSSSSSEDDGQGGRKKKGMREKMREKLSFGKHKDKEENAPHPTTVTSETRLGEHPVQQEHEKKSVMEKIKEKFPGYH